MTGFNRNIFTEEDINHFKAGNTPLTLDSAPPAGAPNGQSQLPVPTKDDYLTKLLKFVPLEIIGFYLFAAGVIEPNVEGDTEQWWLGILLAVVVVATAVYSANVLNVKRVGQIAMAVLGVAAYIFSNGGVFKTFDWYEAWQGTIAIGGFALIAGLIKLKPLPTPSP